MTAWADELAVKSPDYIEFASYDFILGKKRQVLTVGIGLRRWELSHIEANPHMYRLPVGWEFKCRLRGEFLVINRETA